MYYVSNLTCGFGTQSLSPFSVTSALVLSHVKTLLLKPFPSSVCSHCLLIAQRSSSRSESPVPTVVGVVCPHSCCQVRVNNGDPCCHTLHAKQLPIIYAISLLLVAAQAKNNAWRGNWTPGRSNVVNVTPMATTQVTTTPFVHGCEFPRVGVNQKQQCRIQIIPLFWIREYVVLIIG
jgi:hypothetical protein